MTYAEQQLARELDAIRATYDAAFYVDAAHRLVIESNYPIPPATRARLFAREREIVAFVVDHGQPA